MLQCVYSSGPPLETKVIKDTEAVTISEIPIDSFFIMATYLFRIQNRNKPVDVFSLLQMRIAKNDSLLGGFIKTGNPIFSITVQSKERMLQIEKAAAYPIKLKNEEEERLKLLPFLT